MSLRLRSAFVRHIHLTRGAAARMSRSPCSVYNMSNKLTEYARAWQFQKVLMENTNAVRKSTGSCCDSLLIVQHPSIYTLGRGATVDNLKFDVSKQSKHKVVRVERGGEVTWHGPGQVVAYPIFNLHNHKKDLHWFANRLEETVIETLKEYKVTGERSDVNTGVWVGKNKISAIGVTASRWITMHGIALNANSDLGNFGHIIPCGIALPDRGVTSLSVETGTPIDQEALVNIWLANFAQVFNLELSPCDSPDESLNSLLEQYPAVNSSKLDLLV